MGSVIHEIKRRTGNKNNSEQRRRRGLIHFNTPNNLALYLLDIWFLVVIILKVSRRHFTKSLKSSYTFKVFKGIVLILRVSFSFTSAAQSWTWYYQEQHLLMAKATNVGPSILTMFSSWHLSEIIMTKAQAGLEALNKALQVGMSGQYPKLTENITFPKCWTNRTNI